MVKSFFRSFKITPIIFILHYQNWKPKKKIIYMGHFQKKFHKDTIYREKIVSSAQITKI